MDNPIEIRLRYTPALTNPVLVCGLPDSGHVAKLVIDHLINEIHAELFAQIFSRWFPPRVHVKSDGTVELTKHELFSWRGENKAGDLIIYTGDSQPTSSDAAYEVADRVVETCRKFGAEKIITVGAYITGKFAEAPRVFGSATDPELLKELDSERVIRIKHGNITWMNGLLLGIGKLRGMKGIFLSGETSGYVVDAKAAEAVVRTLAIMLGLKIDTAALRERAKETEELIHSIEQMRERREPGEIGYIG